jgi:cell wall-associated NlpC family hydrolase
MRLKVLVSSLVLVIATSLAMAQTAAEPGKATGKIIGKLGQAMNATKIYANRSLSARVYWDVKVNDYLVVNVTDDPKWLSVLLRNGSKGYVTTDDVISLPYDVVVPEEQAKAISNGTSTSPGATQEIQQMLSFSYQYIGTPYRWGGNSLTQGIDCSGFIQQVFKRRGISLPRTAAEQAKVGSPVERLEQLKAGDRLYFWDSRRNMIGHCGIFMGFFPDGGAYFIHSSSNNRGIDTDDLRNEHWRNMLVGARRD